MIIKKVYLVEADEMYALGIDYHFRELQHYRIITFKTAEACMLAIAKECPDVLIMGNMLSGIKELQLFSKTVRETSDVYIVLLYNFADHKVIDKALVNGLNGIVRKDHDVIENLRGEFRQAAKVSNHKKKRQTRARFLIAASFFAFITLGILY